MHRPLPLVGGGEVSPSIGLAVEGGPPPSEVVGGCGRAGCIPGVECAGGWGVDCKVEGGVGVWRGGVERRSGWRMLAKGSELGEAGDWK